MRSREITRKAPTPIATAPTRTALGTLGTCSARTCKSGSAIVISIPRIKQTNNGPPIFFVRLISIPMPSPIGIMDISAPIVKKPMPIISITAPNKNSTNAPEDNGKSVILRIKTIAVNGSTEASDSIIFSFKRIFSNRKIPPFRVFQEIPDFPSVLLSILSSRTFPCQSVLRLLNIKHSVTALLFILCSYFI